MTVTEPTSTALPEPPWVSGGTGETGHLDELRTDPIGLMQRVRDECGDAGQFRLADKELVLLSGADANEVFFRASDDDLDHEGEQAEPECEGERSLGRLAAAGQRRAVVVAGPAVAVVVVDSHRFPLCQLGGVDTSGLPSWSMAPTAPAEPSGRVAVVPVRAGTLPAGALDAARAAAGHVVVVGDGAAAAAAGLAGVATEVRAWDTPGFAPAAWAATLAPVLAAERIVVLPASPDGRDLAPRVALELDRPVLAGAVSVHDDVVATACIGGSVLAEHLVADPVVVTVQPGPGSTGHGAAPRVETIEPTPVDGAGPDAVVVEVLPPDVTTMDLAEARRILGGGAGLDSAERFDRLTEVATALGASMGATRVVTDRGWVPHSRQIGTTGVVVDPDLYLAFGISGAVQHTAGLGDPAHVISVNTDPHCPMMAMADLAVVADANATVDALADLLVGDPSEGDLPEGDGG